MGDENFRTLYDEFLELLLGTCIDKRLWIAEDEKRRATVSPDRKVNGIHQDFFFVDEKGVCTYQLLRAILDGKDMTIHLILIKTTGCT